jgi:hypothetical protein
MPAELRWNRLVISAESEQEFLQAVFDYFPQLLQLPYEEVEVDITGTQEISEDAFRSIAIKLIGGEAAEKKMRIRIPQSVDRYFRHANLYRMVEIDVVRPLPGNGNMDANKVKTNIKAGRYDLKGAPKLKPTASLPKQEKGLSPEPAELEPQPSKPTRASRRPEKATKTDIGFLMDVENGARHEIKEKLVVGRETPSDVIYHIPTISKRHFMIRRKDGGFIIEDLRSTNGTYLNGLPVHEPVPLRDGDEIVVAITLKHPKGARIFQFTTKG